MSSAARDDCTIKVDVNSDASLPTFGGTVRFVTAAEKYGGPVHRAYIYVQLRCYQGDNIVVDAATKPPSSTFTLGQTGSPWAASGGAAHCVADLFYWSAAGKYTVLASTAFEALP
jgi:hypothetical protein